MVAGMAAATGGVIVRAPAKINLELRVGPRRADGFHELATVFHAVSVFDDLSATLAEPGSGVALRSSNTDTAWKTVASS